MARRAGSDNAANWLRVSTGIRSRSELRLHAEHVSKYRLIIDHIVHYCARAIGRFAAPVNAVNPVQIGATGA